jgi:E3 ubiquitin-protein ligase UBR7
VELFSKRNFRCDCGNSKKASGRCTLCPQKDNENVGNVYNHNYFNRYCRCRGTYNPDSDVMYQCFMCEDWFHDRCLGQPIPNPHQWEDLLCQECVSRLPMLTRYRGIEIQFRSGVAPESNAQTGPAPHPVPGCRLPPLAQCSPRDMYMPDGWRTSVLCRCTSCVHLLRAAKMEYFFVADKEIDMGTPAEPAVSQYDLGMQAAAQLPAHQAATMGQAMNAMRTNIADIISEVQRDGRNTVTGEDVERAMKRPRLE